MIHYFTNTINSAWKQKGPITFIYLISLLISFILSFKVYEILNDNIGNALILERMKGGFNKQVFWDILNQYKHLKTDLIIQFGILLLTYLLLSIILQGGLIYNISKNQKSILGMLKAGIKHVYPFFIIASISLIILLLSLAILWIVYFKILGHPFDNYTTEKPFVISFIIMDLISFIVMGKVWAFSVLCRLSYIHQHNIIKSLETGANLLKKNILKILIVWVLILIVGFLLSGIFLFLNASNSSDTLLMTLSTALLMQLLMWIKSLIKAIGYSAIHQLYRTKSALIELS